MTTLARPTHAGWLRSAQFDLTFIVGIAAIGIGSGAIVAARPELFRVVLICDLWLLAYHHVIATYTRLCFDLQSARANRFLLVQLPPLVIAAVLVLYFAVGAWAITTLYLYWQWWHYTRQSYGVGQIYKRKAPTGFTQPDLLTKGAIYLLPLWGIIHRSNQDPAQFLGLDVWTLSVPAPVETLAAVAAAVSIVAWLVERGLAARRGEIAVAHTLYMLSHWAVFAVGYVVIDDIDAGWITINIWHNAQYVLFVWLFNTNRFAAGIDARARFLSALSQRRNMALYFATVAGIGILVYASTTAALTAIGSGLPLVLIVYQAVNFHHYIVDSRIWKVRKKPLQQTLRLQTIDDAA